MQLQQKEELITGFNIKQAVLDRLQAVGLKSQVLGDGPLNARIAIVGEAPGHNEVLTGIPFSGGSGRLLWDSLRRFGINRTECYVTNVMKYQLHAGSDNDDVKVPKHELDHWNAIVRWEIDQLKDCRYILLLGNAALEAFFGHRGVSLWRGSVLNHGNRQCVVTYNPAAVLREKKSEPVLMMDCMKLARVMRGDYKPLEIVKHINPSYRDALAWIEKMKREGKPVSTDIETIAGETACVGLANSKNEGMCISFRGLKDNTYSREEEMQIWLKLQELFDDEAVRLVAQNGMFDSYFLWIKSRTRIRKIWFDTLLGHHTLYPMMPHSLAFLTSQYVDHAYYKDDKDKFSEGGDIDGFWRYNVTDCCVTHAVHEKVHEELRQYKLEDFFFNHVMRLQPHLVRMTSLGIRFDMQLKDQVDQELSAEVRTLEDTFYTQANEAMKSYNLTPPENFKPNPLSPKQLQDLLFNKLKLVGRGDKTDDDNRKRIMAHPRTNETAKAMIATLNDFKEKHKFLSTYVKVGIDPDGRMRSEYKQFGTQRAPGRLSSSSLLWGNGANLQNQPEQAEKMFVADDGYCFAYFDMSQIEARIVAWAWDVPALKENFHRANAEQGFDVHRANAARIFKKPYEEIPEKDRIDNKITLRFLGKRCVHGLNYRMGPDRLAETCKIPMQQAFDAYRAYHEAFPEIRKAWTKIETTARKERMLWTPMGRRLPILGRIDDEALESIVAFEPQSTAGDFVCSVIYKCHDDPEWPLNARMVLNVHDALIAMCKIEDKEKVLRLMKKHAETPIAIKGELVMLPCALKVSEPDEKGYHRWSSLKEFVLK